MFTELLFGGSETVLGMGPRTVDKVTSLLLWGVSSSALRITRAD